MLKFLIILLFPLLVFANDIDSSCPNNTIWGSPKLKTYNNTQVLCNAHYAVLYDFINKAPIYSVEHITPDNLISSQGRTNNFREDDRIPASFRVENSDYTKSKYDRGHLAPAGDFVFDKEAMSDSFLLSNMVPQVPSNNRGIWRVLEDYARDLAAVHKDTYIITGTIFSVPHYTIGKGVGVPTYLYKIIIQPDTNIMLAYLIPNKAISGVNLAPYKVTVKALEIKTGINFSPLIPVNLKQLEFK